MLIWWFILHHLADGVFQSREMAKQKSEKLNVLFDHCLIQFMVFFIGVFLATQNMKNAFLFALLNALVHGIIDWNIWRQYKISVLKRIPFQERKHFKFWEDKKFYDTIMLDQLLHVITITALYYYILV